jgi:sporulation protein YlmC with PRC-barrel domain
MTNRILIFLTLASSLPLGAAAAQSVGTTGQPTPSTSPSPQVQRVGNTSQAGLTRGSTLVGKHIFDPNGTSIGQIRDLVIASDGQVIAVIDRQGGGFTGVPLASISPQLERSAPAVGGASGANGAGAGATGASGATGTGGANPQTTAVDRFIFTGDMNQLRSAPVLQDLSMLDEQWPRSTSEHFGLAAAEARSLGQPATPAGPGITSGDSSSSMGVRQPMAFQSLMKRQLNSVSGERIGNLRDVAIDLDTGRASFVVFGRPATGATGVTGAAGASGTTETLHGVGLDALSFNDASTAQLDMDTASIDQSTGIDLARLPREPSLRATQQRGAVSRKPAQPGQGGQSGSSSGSSGQAGQPRPSSSGSSTPRGGGGTPKS